MFNELGDSYLFLVYCATITKDLRSYIYADSVRHAAPLENGGNIIDLRSSGSR